MRRGELPVAYSSTTGSEQHTCRSYAPVVFYSGIVPAGVWPVGFAAAINTPFTVALANTIAPPVSFSPYKCTNSMTSSSGCNSKNNGPCTHNYYRTISYLSSATLRVVLPDACGNGPCTPISLVFSPCSTYVGAVQTSSARCRASAQGTARSG